MQQSISPNPNSQKCSLKLASSSKCKLAESNIDDATPHYILEESTVRNMSILNNFHVLQRKDIEGGEMLVAAEK